MKKIKLIQNFKLVWSVLLIAYVDLFVGCASIFPAVLFAQLKNPASSLKVNDDEVSWIASINTLVSPLGFLIIGPLTDKIGRRKALNVTYLSIILSWLIFLFADSYRAILIGRVMQGFTISATPCTYVFAAEICRADQRQLFTAIMSLFVGVGMTFLCVLAIPFHWRTICAILLAMSAVGCASLFMLPESPVWLRTRGRVRQAEKAERWYGLEPPAATEGPAATEPSDENDGGGGEGDGRVIAKWWSVYTRRAVWKPALVIMALFTFQHMAGLYVLFSYSVYVLENFGVRWDSIPVTALLCAGRVLGSIVFSTLHRVRRKTLAVASSAGMAVSLAVIMAFSLIFSHAAPNSVTVVAFFTFVLSAMLGVLPLPWISCSEMFPRAVTGTVSSFMHIYNSLVLFSVIKMYPMAVSLLGIDAVWSIFIITCILSALFGVFILPETKGKTLDEIVMSFESSKKTINNNNNL